MAVRGGVPTWGGLAALALGSGLAACGSRGGGDGSAIRITPGWFPMEEARWTYASAAEDGTLRVDNVGPAETVQSTTVRTFTYATEAGDVLARVKWSADAGEALRIHAWSEGLGDFEVFDPPVALTPEDGWMRSRESVTTESAGYVFTANLIGREGCTVPYGGELEWDCLRFLLDDGDGDDATGPFFAGEWGLVEPYGVGWMRVAGRADAWELVADQEE